MYDPIPWHLDEMEAARRGLARAGWYMMGDGDEPVAGPHEEPEACVMEMSDRARALGAFGCAA
jgi:hypothetical protein